MLSPVPLSQADYLALFNNLPIKKKLVTMSTVSCLVGIFLAGCAFLVFDIIQYRQGQAKGLQAIAQIIADQSNAALEFDDLRQANTNLSALSAISNINVACIYKQKSLFAEYYREQGSIARCPSNAIAPPPLWHEMSLSGVADVTLNQASLGRVIVQSDLPDLEIRLWLDASVTLLIIVGACLISFGMANNLHNRIIGPLLRLGETAKYFAEHKNYSVRAQIDSNDEIGQVAIAFNQMMSRIQRDNSELEKLSSAVQRSGSSVLITDNKGFVEYVNSRYLEVSGFSEDNVIGTLADIFDTARTQRGQHAELWHKVLSGENWHGEVRNRGQNGKLYWSLQSISSIKDEQDHIKHLVIVGEDVTELKASQQKVERMAFYDVLTGLENRRLFRDRVEQSLRAHHRYHHHLAIFFLDLDQFKRINDTLGHDAGDELLITVARRLRSSVREEDTVSRQGGDEFTLLLQNIESPENAERVARNILHTLTKPITLDGKSLTITASIGITLAPDDADTFTSLMKQADLAMYKAKELGRNTYHFYTESINKRPESALALEFDLRQAYQDEQFCLFYQPQVRLSANHPSDMEIIGVEALLRWFHPQKGMVSPVDFIPIAEEIGLICDLGKWVLNEACAEAKRLALAGTPVRVAVNIAAQQLRDADFIVSVKNALETNGLEAQLLEIEITESSVMDDIGKAISILEELRDLGVSVSVDDFGTGYSSLSYLRRLPVNSLKIDRSFVKDIPHNRSDTEITAAVIAMAHKLNLEVVAEGVETEEHVTFLLQNNCDFGQGFLFATPLPADQLTLLLAKTPQEVIPTATTPLAEPNLAPQTRH